MRQLNFAGYSLLSQNPNSQDLPSPKEVDSLDPNAQYSLLLQRLNELASNPPSDSHHQIEQISDIVDKTEKLLLPAEEEQLSPVHQIAISLLKSLLETYSNHRVSANRNRTIFKLLVRHVQSILIGYQILTTDLTEGDSEYYQNWHGLTQWRSAASKAEEQYQNYCINLRYDYHAILTKYVEYLEKSTASTWHYWRKGYFYNGPHQHRQTFIRLIDRLALTNKQFIYDLLPLIPDEEGLTFNFEQQSNFVGKLYEIFQKVQQNYYDTLVSEDLIYLKHLNQYYLNKNADAAIDVDLRAYYKCIVNDQENIEILKNKLKSKYLNMAIGKLTFDIEQIKSERNEQKEAIDEQLKILKKDIHHFANELGFSSRIFNKKKQPVVVDDEEELYSTKYYVVEPQYGRDFIGTEKQHTRKIKKSSRKWARRSAKIIGFGEFATAGYVFYACLGLPFPIALIGLLLIGFSAWYTTIYLFNNEAYSTLKEIRLGNLFKDEEGRKISRFKIVLICIFGLSAFSVAILNSALIWGSVQAVMASLLSFMPGAAGVILSYGLAVFPAAAAIIGLSCLFFLCVADLIKNWETRKKGLIAYFKNAYGAPWKEMTWKEKLSYPFRVLFELSKLALGLAIVVMVTIAAFPIFIAKTQDFFSSLMNLFNKIIDFQWSKAAIGTTALALAGVDAIASAPFAVERITSETTAVRVRGFLSFTFKALSIIASIATVIPFILYLVARTGQLGKSSQKFARSLPKRIDDFVFRIAPSNTYSDLEYAKLKSRQNVHKIHERKLSSLVADRPKQLLHQNSSALTHNALQKSAKIVEGGEQFLSVVTTGLTSAGVGLLTASGSTSLPIVSSPLAFALAGTSEGLHSGIPNGQELIKAKEKIRVQPAFFKPEKQPKITTPQKLGDAKYRYCLFAAQIVFSSARSKEASVNENPSPSTFRSVITAE